MAGEDDGRGVGAALGVGGGARVVAGIEPGAAGLTLRRTFRYLVSFHGALSRSVSRVVSPVVFVSSPSLSELSDPRSDGPSVGRVALLEEGVGSGTGGGGSSGSCQGGLSVELGGVS